MPKPKWTNTNLESLRTEARTTRDLNGDHLRAVYQPIVKMEDGSLFAHEALIRCTWLEFRNPEKLFTQAVSEGSCGRLGTPGKGGMLPNSAIRTALCEYPSRRAKLPVAGTPRRSLYYYEGVVYLEITESAAFSYFALCKSVLKEVCQRCDGRLVVDDLGAGYSNLKRISDLEPDVVKLDRKLITGLNANPKRQDFVRGLVALCHDMGAQVVAEGVETLAELTSLRDTGVDYVQGYLLAKPAPSPPSYDWPL